MNQKMILPSWRTGNTLKIFVMVFLFLSPAIYSILLRYGHYSVWCDGGFLMGLPMEHTLTNLRCKFSPLDGLNIPARVFW